MGRKYTCKNCGTEFHRQEHDNVCPNCEAPTSVNDQQNEVIEEETESQLNQGEEELQDEEPEPERPSTQEVVGDYEATITKKGNNWRVEFQANRMVNAWVNCPACGKKMFQNNILWGTLEDRCNRCKATVTFVFT